MSTTSVFGELNPRTVYRLPPTVYFEEGETVAVIETSALTKYYGSTPGIIDLDLEIREGEVFGFIGPNGAGKSTTIRTLLNLLFPTSGSGAIFGLDIIEGSLDIRARIGYLPGDLSMYETMTEPVPRKSSWARRVLSASTSVMIGAILYSALTPRWAWAPCADLPLVVMVASRRPRWPR